VEEVAIEEALNIVTKVMALRATKVAVPLGVNIKLEADVEEVKEKVESSSE
jgi:hypothetical protein